MAEEPVQRRLAAILAADVVGYSRAMEADEVGTHARLKALRQELFDLLVAKHHGRIVTTTGDGALVEFASAVDALNCAVELQRGQAKRNGDSPEGKRLLLRIGINIGDIIIDGEDIYGTGVNVAARLEALAEPGGICISGRVLEQVEKNVDVGFAYLGPQSVKNIERPVNAYKVLLNPEDAGKVVGAPASTSHAKQATRQWLTAAAIVLIVVAGAGAWFYQSRPDIEPARTDRMAFPLPDKPSIAVLPLANLSDAPNQKHLSDALTDLLITELSRFPELFVISRHSTLVYEDDPLPVQEIAEQLGIRYVVEGSVQRLKDRVRVNVQLVDALRGDHVWAERYDRQIDDLFAIQDEIVQTVVAALYGKIIRTEQQRIRKKSPEKFLKAYEYTQHAVDLYWQWTEEAVRDAQKFLEKSLEVDSTYIRTYKWLTMVYREGHREGWLDMPRDEALKKARETAERAIEIDPNDYRAHQAMAEVYKEEGNQHKALEELERARDLNPNKAAIIFSMGAPLIYLGRPEDAIARYKESMRLNPHHPQWFYWNLGWAQYEAGQCEAALNSFQQMKPLPLNARRLLAKTYVCLDEIDKARAVLDEFLKHQPDFTIAHWKKGYEHKFQNRTQFERHIDHFRKAGLPENVSVTD